MTWLFPLYLAGAAAVIAPILLHLRKRPPKTRVEFSSLMFLEQTPLVTTTRSRIERWLLLVLRCLALLLLAGMFARPFMTADTQVTQQGRATVVLIDRSASMQHEDQWTRALAKAREVITALQPQDQVAIATFDQSLQRIASFDDLKVRSAGERASRLSDLKCGWQGTNLGKALVESTRWLTEVSAADKRVVLISDLQDGASLEMLRGFAWPEKIAVKCERIEPKNTSNLSASLVSGTAAVEDDTKDTASQLRIRIANARHSDATAFTLRWDDDKTNASEGVLSAGSTRVLRLARPADSKSHVLHLSGDKWPFDNELYLAPPQPRAVSVVALGNAEEAMSVDSPLYYLTLALQPNSVLAPKVSVQDHTPIPDSTAWLVTSNTSPADQAPAVKSWIEQGHQALCLVTDPHSEFLTQLLGVPVTLTEASIKDFALLADLDFTHPVLHSLEDIRLRDFTKIHFWKYRKLQAPALQSQTLARFDSGDPAWLAVPMGKGQLVVMLSGWQPKDSQLALSSKFVPILFGMLAEAGVSLEQPTQYLVGDQPPGAVADKPGFVQSKDNRTFAINLAPEESRIAPLDLQTLASLGVKLESAAAINATSVEKERIANEELESRQQYWLIALIVLLGVVVAETWLAGKRPAPLAA